MDRVRVRVRSWILWYMDAQMAARSIGGSVKQNSQQLTSVTRAWGNQTHLTLIHVSWALIEV